MARREHVKNARTAAAIWAVGCEAGMVRPAIGDVGLPVFDEEIQGVAVGECASELCMAEMKPCVGKGSFVQASVWWVRK